MLSSYDQINFKVFDAWFDYQSRYGNFPGFQVCIRKNNHLLFNKAYGYRNLTTKEVLTPKNLFRIASHSKTFTTCAILKLVEQGLLRLDDFALNYLPELASHKDSNFQKITIRDLLSNRAGLFRDGLDSGIWDLFRPFLSYAEITEDTMSTDLIFPPNEQTKYSNIGFAWLGRVIEVLMGMPYEKAMESLVLKEIQGEIFSDYSDSLSAQLASGHSRTFLDHKRHPLKHAAACALAPAAGFCANASDTNLFFDRLLVAQDLLQKETHRELLHLKWASKNAPADQYGLGLLFTSFSEGQLVGHRGGYPGFSTYTATWLGTGYTFSFFLNTNDVAPILALKSMVQLIAKIKSVFSKEEARQAQVTPIFMGGLAVGTGSVFIVSQKKALLIPIASWMPCDETLRLERKDEETFFCEEQSGYSYLGEKIIFQRNKAGNVGSVKWGGSSFVEEKIFLEKVSKTFA